MDCHGITELKHFDYFMMEKDAKQLQEAQMEG